MPSHKLFNVPPRTKPIIRNLLIIGDSLSDRGQFMACKRLGTWLISLLFPKIPQNRFTNGLVWVDYLGMSLANKFIINDRHRKGFREEVKLNSEDIADGIISNDKRVRKAINRYHLKDPKQILYQDMDFIRSYAEGGLSNHNYNYKLCSHPFTRLLIPYLSNKMTEIKKDDLHRAAENKQETLTIFWSGVCDISLVNNPLDKDYTQKVSLSIESLKKSTEELIKTGYCHFIFITSPDPKFSPRANKYSADELKIASDATQHFNDELKILKQKLKETHPNCSVDINDINPQIQKILEDPEAYFLDKTKIKESYFHSPDYKPIKKVGDIQPAAGYLFADEVHPTTKGHFIIAQNVENMIRSRYQLEAPNSTVSKKCGIF